jgi:hypothetical protein
LTTLNRIKPFLAAMLFVCIAQAPVAHAALLSLQPDTTFTSNGDTVSLDLVVSGLGNFGPDSLAAFDVSVNYDPSLLSFSDYSLGSLLGDLIGFTALDVSGGDTGGGEVNVAEISLLLPASLDALQSDEFILASLSFDVFNPGPDAITNLNILGGATLSDANGRALLVTTGGPATIHIVPLPGTLWLMVSGLVGWRVTRRVRKPGI